MAKKKVMTVFGTRPEAIKICPLVLEMKKRSSLDVIVCVTAQHRQMLDQVLTTFGVVPDYDLNIMKDRQTLFDITTGVLNGIKAVLEEVKPDVVLVHGDTSTTFVTALACFYLQIPDVGWDMVLTTNGWCIMEGNIYGDFMWQLFYDKGMRADFERLIGWKTNKQYWWE